MQVQQDTLIMQAQQDTHHAGKIRYTNHGSTRQHTNQQVYASRRYTRHASPGTRIAQVYKTHHHVLFTCMVGRGVPLTQFCKIGCNQKLFVSSPLVLWLTVFHLSLHRIATTLAIFCRYFHANALLTSLTVCLLSFCGLDAHFFPLTPIVTNSLMQELTNTFNHSFLSLVNSGTPCLPLYFQLPMIWLYLRGRFQDICPFILSGDWQLVSFLPFAIFVVLGRLLPLEYKKGT